MAALSNNKNLATQTAVNVASTSGFTSPSGTALVATTTGLQTVAYTGVTGTSLTIPLNSGTGTMTTGCPVTQPTTSETRGNTTYSLKAEYEWTTAQNAGVGATTIAAASNGQTLPQATVNVVSTSTLSGASVSNPQAAVVATSAGAQTVTYTGTTADLPHRSDRGYRHDGHRGCGHAELPARPVHVGDPAAPPAAGSSWVGDRTADANNVQDSVILNYPPQRHPDPRLRGPAVQR